MKWLPVTSLLIVLGAAVVSGVQVARQAHELRQLHAALQAVQHRQDELMSEYTRLLLERSALAAYQNIERVAVTELSMTFPDQVERIVP